MRQIQRVARLTPFLGITGRGDVREILDGGAKRNLERRTGTNLDADTTLGLAY
jgi:hypothetical protein